MTYTEKERFESEMEDLIQRAEKLIDGPYQAGWNPAKNERCEIIERMDCVIAVLDVPGRDADEILVSVVDGEVRIEGQDLQVRMQLPCRVDSAGLDSEYRNGVLSVRMMKP